MLAEKDKCKERAVSSRIGQMPDATHALSTTHSKGVEHKNQMHCAGTLLSLFTDVLKLATTD